MDRICLLRREVRVGHARTTCAAVPMSFLSHLWFWALLNSGVLLTALFFIAIHHASTKEQRERSLAQQSREPPTPSELAAKFLVEKRPFRSVYLAYSLFLAWCY